MTADLVDCIARETSHTRNRQAWAEILKRLDAAGISNRKAYALREAIWRVRRQSAEASSQQRAEVPM